MNIERRNQLPELMRSLGIPLIVAEIGVAEGRFSLELLQEHIDALYLVDRWTCSSEQKGDGGFPQKWHDSNLQTCKEMTSHYCPTFLRGDSVEMSRQIADASLGMVYVDADHSYEGVKRDVNAWYPKVVPGGIMAFHDYLNVADYGVKKAVEEFCLDNGYSISDIAIIPENHINDAGAYFIKHQSC